MQYDYRKLRGKIKEVFDTQEAFSKAIGLSRTSLSLKLNNSVQFSQDEIYHSINVLGLEPAAVNDYFFTINVREIEQRGE